MMKFCLSIVILFVLSATISCLQIREEDMPELKYLDTNVDPCDDFYSFTCGNFKTYHPRPENTQSVNHFTMLSQEIIELCIKILESVNLKDDPEALKKAKTAYKTCADTEYTDSIPNPELRVINEVDGFPMVVKNKFNKHTYQSEPFSWYEVAELISNYGIPMLFGGIQSVPHYLDLNKTTIYVTKEPLVTVPQTIKSEDITSDEVIESSLHEYAKQSKIRSDSPFDVFLFNVTKKLQLATGNYYTTDEDIENNLYDTKEFMNSLYNANNVDDPVLAFKTTTIYTITIKQLQEWTQDQFGNTTQVDWLKFFQIIFKKTGAPITEDTELLNYNGLNKTFYSIIKLVENTDPDVIKNYCLLRIFLYLAPDSDFQTRQAFLDYFDGIGQTSYPRKEFCARKVMDISTFASISYALAYEYQLRFFNVNKLQKASEMIFDLWDSASDILRDEVDWMDDVSKQNALNKIEKMIMLLAYPQMSDNKMEIDKFYENLRVCSWDNYGNAKRLRALRLAYQLSQIKARDRTAWDKSPFDTNAYYTRATNRITFPAAMLNPVFFSGNVSVLDYARIGSIIGHEITHAFDMNGQQYNEDGVMDTWLTNETKDAINERSECFKEQYSKYYVEEIGQYINGSTTLNENLADNGGIKEAFKAIKKNLLRHAEYFTTSTYTTDQLFFIGYGTIWCSEASDAYLENLLKAGTYSTERFRVNGPLSNLPEFSEAFNCPSGSNMNPQQKCKLW